MTLQHFSCSRLPAVLIVVFILGTTGCSLHFRSAPTYDPGTAEVLARAEKLNQTVTAVNGLGSITLTDNGTTKRYRLAWAAESPDRLKMIVLFSGKPVETFVYDGKRLSLTSHTQAHDPILRRSKNPNLKRLISLPLTTEEIIVFLTGRIPIPEHRSGRLETGQQDKIRLCLYARGETPRGILELTPDKTISAYEIHSAKGIRYRIDFQAEDPDRPPGPRLPVHFFVSRGDQSMDLRIDKTHANPALPVDTFFIP